MFEELPTVFTRNDVVQYRIDHDYQHDVYSQAIITRWKNQGLVAPSKDKTWVKM